MGVRATGRKADQERKQFPLQNLDGSSSQRIAVKVHSCSAYRAPLRQSNWRIHAQATSECVQPCPGTISYQ